MKIRARLVCVVAGFFALGCCGLSAQTTTKSIGLENTQWRLVWLPGVKIESPTVPRAAYIELDSRNHRMRGSGGCNTLMGGYEVEGNHLKFMAPVRTMMACRGMTAEDALVSALSKARKWKVSGTTLSLLDAGGHVLARFEAT